MTRIRPKKDTLVRAVAPPVEETAMVIMEEEEFSDTGSVGLADNQGIVIEKQIDAMARSKRRRAELCKFDSAAFYRK